MGALGITSPNEPDILFSGTINNTFAGQRKPAKPFSFSSFHRLEELLEASFCGGSARRIRPIITPAAAGISELTVIDVVVTSGPQGIATSNDERVCVGTISTGTGKRGRRALLDDISAPSESVRTALSIGKTGYMDVSTRNAR